MNTENTLNEDMILGKEQNITLKEIIEVLPRLPNAVVGEFYIDKVNGTLKKVQSDIIELFNLSNSLNINSEELNTIIHEIIEVENSKWSFLHKENLLAKIKQALTRLQEHNELSDNSTINQINIIIESWIPVEENIKITNQDNLFSLYKYIHPEEFKIQTLNELADIYSNMF